VGDLGIPEEGDELARGGRANLPSPSGGGTLASMPSASEGRPIDWVPALSQEESLERVPPGIRRIAQKATGDVVSWCAQADSDRYDAGTSSFTYVVLGRSGLIVTSGRHDPNPPPRAGGRRWRSSITTGLIRPESVRTFEAEGPPYRGRSGGGPGRRRASGWMTDYFRGAVGRLPEQTQLFILAPFADEEPQAYGWWAHRPSRDGWVFENAWFWLLGRASMTFAEAERSVYIRSSADAAYDDLERTVWNATAWRADLTSVNRREVWVR